MSGRMHEFSHLHKTRPSPYKGFPSQSHHSHQRYSTKHTRCLQIFKQCHVRSPQNQFINNKTPFIQTQFTELSLAGCEALLFRETFI